MSFLETIKLIFIFFVHACREIWFICLLFSGFSGFQKYRGPLRIAFLEQYAGMLILLNERYMFHIRKVSFLCGLMEFIRLWI